MKAISGIVTPSEWSEDGEVTGIKLCTPGEIDYSVEPDHVSAALFQCLQKRVQVKGVIGMHKNGTSFLKVRSFKIQP